MSHLETGNLAQGVDTGIRATGAVHHDASAFDSRERRFEHGLDTRRVLLTLPPSVGRAVIGNRQSKRPHQLV